MLKADYPDFLREQIELEPRVPEWTSILKKRLAALEPYVEKLRINANFHHGPHWAYVDIDPKTKRVIRFETD